MTYSANNFFGFCFLRWIQSSWELRLRQVDGTCVLDAFVLILLGFCFYVAAEKFDQIFVNLAKTSKVLNHFWWLVCWRCL